MASQLEELKQQQAALNKEKVDLENQLEAEQEYVVNKLQKQLEGLAKEKLHLQQEKLELRRQARRSFHPPDKYIMCAAIATLQQKRRDS